MANKGPGRADSAGRTPRIACQKARPADDPTIIVDSIADLRRWLSTTSKHHHHQPDAAGTRRQSSEEPREMRPSDSEGAARRIERGLLSKPARNRDAQPTALAPHCRRCVRPDRPVSPADPAARVRCSISPVRARVAVPGRPRRVRRLRADPRTRPGAQGQQPRSARRALGWIRRRW